MTKALGKKWWNSKTLWVNILAALAMFLQQEYGFVLDPGAQAILLAGLNFALRLDTAEPVRL